MKSSKARKRHDAIIEMLHSGKTISVEEICSEFGCSASTIRNDLNYLAEEKQIIRVFGGAKGISSGPSLNSYSDENDYENMDKKSSEIAHYVVEHILQSHSTIILDTGITCEKIAALLAEYAYPISVLTFSMPIIHLLTDAPNINLFSFGGFFDKSRNAFYDDYISEHIQYLHADIYFMATSSVSPEAGFTISCPDTPITERAMMSIAARTVALCDSSNLSKSSYRVISDFTQISTMVTDSLSDPMQVKRLKDAGLNVFVADAV